MIRMIRATAVAGATLAFTAAAALWASPALARDGVPQSVTAFLEAAASPAAAAVAVQARAPRGLVELVDGYAGAGALTDEQNCLASAVYFEARGESLEGQLAVAEVVMNRARSGRYPATLCGVVVQPSQFSFVRRGRIPAADRGSDAWRRAVAISHIAESRAQRMLGENVLWYHARYVRPGWGRRLDRSNQIGAHIFYR